MTRTSCIIQFGQNSIEIKEDASIAIINGGSISMANVDDLENGTVASKPYATFEPNYWLLDGNYKIAPASGAHGGWISSDISGSGGNFDFGTPKPELQIDFDDVHSTDGLYFTFSHSGDYADSLRVVFYNASLVTIRDDTYSPTGTTFFTNQPIANFKRILIGIHSTNRASRRARLVQLDFDEVTEFSGEQVKAAKVIQQIDPLSTELTIDTLDLTLFSDDGDFSIVNPAGVYANLQYKEPLDVYEDAGDIIYIGRFYLDKWESISENEATFQASDAVGLMETIPYRGIIEHNEDIFPISTADLIDDIMADTGLDYEIDGGVTGISHFGEISGVSCREALQQVCFAIGAYVTCARSNIVRILPLVLAEDVVTEDYTLTSAEKGISSPLTLKPLVTGVEVTSHSYRADVDSDVVEVFRGRFATGDHLIIFEYPVHDNTFTDTTATYTISTFAYAWMTINVTGAGLLVSQAQGFFDSPRVESLYNGALPAGTPDNIIRITDATMVYPETQPNPPGGTVYPSIADDVVARVYAYHQQRYLQKTRLYAHTMKPGDSVLVDVQGGAQMMGIVERMDIDLAGGFVSDVEIVGILV